MPTKWHIFVEFVTEYGNIMAYFIPLPPLNFLKNTEKLTFFHVFFFIKVKKWDFMISGDACTITLQCYVLDELIL